VTATSGSAADHQAEEIVMASSHRHDHEQAKGAGHAGHDHGVRADADGAG
jgi:hypothetical protein